MAEFQASLTDGNGNIPFPKDIVVYDYSNYITNDEDGNSSWQFSDYVRYIITRPDGSKYEINSLGTGDETCQTPNLSITNPITISSSIMADPDGWYNIRLIVLPNWTTSVSYTIKNYVYKSDTKKIYKCIVAHTSNIFDDDLAGGKWEEITSDENISTKYNVSVDVATNYMVDEKSRVFSIEMADVINNEGINTELITDNPLFVKTWKSYIVKDALSAINDTGLFTATEVIANLGATL